MVFANAGMTCGSEFIRERPVQATHLHRMTRFSANEFAPTGIAFT